MPIIGSIREIDTLCMVSLRRVNVSLLRQDKVGMLTYEIPEDLAKEALMHTDTYDEAQRYVQNAVNEIKLEWPDSVPSEPTPTTKCGPSEWEGSN